MRDKGLFTVVVADDEEELREAVCRLIPWESIGFQLLGSAGNGLDALQLVEQLQPDLLLTDIHMPFITGTSLAKQVRELQPFIQVAFLSGYDDFEYAKLAIDYDVIAYLLKPISMEELAAALGDIHVRMEAKFNDLSAGGDTGGALPLAVASLLLDGFAEFPGEEETHAALAERGFVVTAPYRLVVLAVHIGSRSWADAAQTVDKVLRRYYSCCSVASGGRILTLVAAEDGFSRLGSALDELLQVLRRLFSPDCVIGVSREFSFFSQCHSACREAVDIQRFSGEVGILRVRDTTPAPAGQHAGAENAAQELEKLMHGASRYELEKYLSGLLSDGAGASGGDMVTLQVLVAARDILFGSLESDEASLLFKRCGLLEPLTSGLDIGLLRRRITDLCIFGHELLTEKKQGGVGQLCGQAMRMIEQSYMDENLSLNSVSEQLHVSPNYLSANMKKYAGDTFMNLLIKRRMEAALSLISESHMKTSEVARRCGYTDQHYFSFCFKKYYGVSPAQMRRGGGKGEANEA